MRRFAQLIKVKPEALDEYKRIHASVWPSVLNTIKDCNIHNYSIFLKESEHMLFAYFEYHGKNFEADMQKMAADPETKRWWAITDPMQEPFETRKEGEWWTILEEVFHTD